MLVDPFERMAAEMYGGKLKQPRIDTRFCSASCRQQSYEARKFGVWTIDGKTLTGQQLVDRGWTLFSFRGERRHSRNKVRAARPGQEPHPLQEMRPYRKRS
jgi:hypothetical protein